MARTFATPSSDVLPRSTRSPSDDGSSMTFGSNSILVTSLCPDTVSIATRCAAVNSTTSRHRKGCWPSHLQHALEQRRRRGFNDIADQLRVKLKEQDPGTFGKARIRHEARLGGVDKLVAAVVTGSLMESCLNIGAYGPPSGDPCAANIDAVAEQRRIAPFRPSFRAS